jgi:hypothetical protein
MAVAFEFPGADVLVAEADAVSPPVTPPDGMIDRVRVGVLVLGDVEMVEVTPPVTTAARVMLK